MNDPSHLLPIFHDSSTSFNSKIPSDWLLYYGSSSIKYYSSMRNLKSLHETGQSSLCIWRNLMTTNKMTSGIMAHFFAVLLHVVHRRRVHFELWFCVSSQTGQILRRTLWQDDVYWQHTEGCDVASNIKYGDCITFRCDQDLTLRDEHSIMRSWMNHDDRVHKACSMLKLWLCGTTMTGANHVMVKYYFVKVKSVSWLLGLQSTAAETETTIIWHTCFSISSQC